MIRPSSRATVTANRPGHRPGVSSLERAVDERVPPLCVAYAWNMGYRFHFRDYLLFVAVVATWTRVFHIAFAWFAWGIRLHNW